MIENKRTRIIVQIIFYILFFATIAYFDSIEKPEEKVDPGYKIAPTDAEIQQIEVGTR